MRDLGAGSVLAVLAFLMTAPAVNSADLYGYGHGYPPVEAVPCGYWPHNLGQNWANQPYYNFGCATENNLAAMVENPDDLYAPRPMTPRDSMRRDTIYEQYRTGVDTSAASGTDSAGTASGE